MLPPENEGTKYNGERVTKGYFAAYVSSHSQKGELIVQPRMGFSDLELMRRGLSEVKGFPHPRIGTITLDSMTRQRMFRRAKAVVRAGKALNGYPLVTYGSAVTKRLIDGLHGADFPIQVRHGSPLPREIFRVCAESGIDAIEGGPISYCLPYGRVSIRESVSAWGDCCRFWVEAGVRANTINHIESFAGCMLGQLCPPSLLVALSILEGLFFLENGIINLSLSHSQGTNSVQDISAMCALRRLADEFLQDASVHVVFYTWMGAFPETERGAQAVIKESARVAVIGGAARLIVKTAVEATHLPTVDDNLRAMAWASEEAKRTSRADVRYPLCEQYSEEIYEEAKTIIEAVRNLSPSVGQAILIAFRRGYLDIPLCIHPDNLNSARAAINGKTGLIEWRHLGRLPLPERACRRVGYSEQGSASLLRDLFHNRRKYDEGAECGRLT